MTVKLRIYVSSDVFDAPFRIHRQFNFVKYTRISPKSDLLDTRVAWVAGQTAPKLEMARVQAI